MTSNSNNNDLKVNNESDIIDLGNEGELDKLAPISSPEKIEEGEKVFAENNKLRKKKKIKRFFLRFLRRLVMAIAMCVIVYASYSLTKSYLDYKTGNTTYSNINAMFITQADDDETDEDDNDNDGNEDIDDSLKYDTKTGKWVWDYDAMLSVNTEAKGYIRQESSRIQYPILQHDDNEYYLTHAADKTYNANGAIFIDSECTDGLEAQNCVIFGHNMWTDSMFGSLLNYESEEYYKNNRTFDIYIGYKHYVYYVFAAYTTQAKVDSTPYQTGFSSLEDFTEWEKKCINSTLYYTDITSLNADDKIITLSTCTRSDNSRRFVVQLVRGEEVVD